MKFGIIFVLMIIVGSTGLFATPAWMTPEMQEAMAQVETLNARMIYETRPEVITPVLEEVNYWFIRLESFPRGREKLESMRQGAIAMQRAINEALTLIGYYEDEYEKTIQFGSFNVQERKEYLTQGFDCSWFGSMHRSMVYTTLNMYRSMISSLSGIYRELQN